MKRSLMRKGWLVEAFKLSEKTRDEYILTQLMRTYYATTDEGKSLIYKETMEQLQGETK